MNTRRIHRTAWEQVLFALTAMLAAVGISMMPFAIPQARAAQLDANITISEPEPADSTNMQLPSLNGLEFTAYRLGEFNNVVVSNNVISGFNMVPSAGITADMLMGWIKDAVTTNGAVGSNFTSTVQIDGSTIKFIGEAASLNPLQFIGTYFIGNGGTAGAGSDVYGNPKANNAQMRKFANAAQATLSAGAPTGVVTATATGANNKAILNTSGNEGMYLILQTGGTMPANQLVSRAMIAYTPITVNAGTANAQTYTSVNGYTLGQIKLKAEKVVLTKNAYTTGGENTLVTVGSVHPFTITVNVPEYETSYQSWNDPVFKIVDNPAAGIRPTNSNNNINNLKVVATAANGTTTGLGNNDYIVDVTNGGSPDTNDFSITLTNPAQWSGQKIQITYDATVESLGAVLANNAEVQFSNDPANPSTASGSVAATAYMYSTSIPLEKVVMDHIDQPLTGATFRVWAGTNPQSLDGALKFNEVSGNYVASATGTTQDITLGSANLLGLGSGDAQATTYTFIETKSPDGYLLGTNPVRFTITITPTFDNAGALTSVNYELASASHRNFIDMSDGALLASGGQTVTAPTTNVTSTTLTSGQVVIENTKSLDDFAATGGTIMRIVTAVAALVLVGAVLLLIAKKRRKSAR